MAQISIIGRVTKAGKAGSSKTGKATFETSLAENYKDAVTFYELSAWEGVAGELAAFGTKDLIKVSGTIKAGDAGAYMSGETPKPRIKVTVNAVSRYEKAPTAEPATESAASLDEALA